jgi:pyruvate,water dikinase
MDWIFTSTDGRSGSREDLGGKAAALRDAAKAGLPVPPWFVASPRAFRASLSGEQQGLLESPDGVAALAARLADVCPADAVRREIDAAVAALDPAGGPVAVRSSAVDEDGTEHSFAGQLDSYLFVRPEDVAAKVAAVWRSAFSDHILSYRKQHGLDAAPRPPAVLVQRMIDADAAGVAFAADPTTGRRGVAIVAAVLGLGTSLVGGDADADTFHVDRAGRIAHRHIAAKHIAHQRDADAPEGVRAVEVPEPEASRPAVADEQILAIADLARRASQHFGRPQDVEWAINGGTLYLLQSRPITTLAALPDPEGAPILWDNSNIVESYGGITTPLTFSFARRAYEEVYRQFCRIMGVPAAVIAGNDDVFRNMLGLIRGRIYYNLLSWYRLLAMLPGFQVNRGFMEQMMGVKEPLPDEMLARVVPPASRLGRARDTVRLTGSVFGLLWNQVRIRPQVAAFYRRLNAALAEPDPPLGQLRPDELAAHYRGLERQLLRRWDAPLVNDFLAMIFYGVLRTLARKWCGDEAGTLQNDLISTGGGMVSAEPARRVKEMAAAARADPQLVSLLNEAPADEILAAIDQRPAFAAQYRAYLDKFGDRCLEELKLESPTLHDDPLLLLRAVGRLARSDGPARREVTTGGGRVDESLRRQAEERAAKALAEHRNRRIVFDWVLRNARDRVRDRENLRFERTRLFGRCRRVFVELGRRLHAEGVLDAPGDVFFLEVEELLGFVEGTATTTRLRELAALRRAEFESHRDLPAPDERFETRGAVHLANDFRRKSSSPADTHAGTTTNGDQLQGIGCCPGVVRGRVRVITDPRNADLPPGSILVARSTDPGWIMLFPAAAGLLVERGSLLSHSAIVSREMGLPAIVSVPGVTTWLKDGDEVEMDGGTGVVRRVGASDGVAGKTHQ